ncbi:hypothetical protein KKF61_03180, partial [Patescibacteria group bacterium]|nr:hypothetical protein [Patescibacteria group bacterium]
KLSRLFMRESSKILHAPLPSLTDRQLIKLFKNCLLYHRQQHGIGASISWQADADKERVTRGIWQKIETHLRQTGSSHELADIFGILTTPEQESLAALEEKDFLRLAILIKSKPKALRIFKTNEASEIMKKLHQADESLYNKINKHYRNYCWLTYQYKGPAASLEQFLGRWQTLVKGQSDPKSLLKKFISERKQVLNQQKLLNKQIKLTPYLKKIVRMGQRLVYIKDFRKYALYHGMYCYEPLFIEIGRRLGLTISQIWAMNTWEIPDALLKRQFNVHELNERQKLAVAYTDAKKYVVYTGQTARNFLTKVVFEKQFQQMIGELHGTPACSGKAVGTVKIVNLPTDMKKMKQGDIMVAHNTNPNLVPAMKKAAALVSEAGGLTCHTAIVARELRIPSVVGVPGADKILHDGDRVKVDATHGIIKKI